MNLLDRLFCSPKCDNCGSELLVDRINFNNQDVGNYCADCRLLGEHTPRVDN